LILEVTEHHRVDARRIIAWLRFKAWAWWPFWSYAEVIGYERGRRSGVPDIEWFCPKRGLTLNEGERITRLVMARETFDDFTKETTTVDPWPEAIPIRRAQRR
jgi:hypothetical protein